MNRAFPQVLGPGESTNFTSVNRGKRDITLNLKTPEARDLVHRLVERMDVVIQSFLPKTATDLGVDYETLSAINPNLIYASISGYGAKGELKNKPGYDLMVSAYGGIISMTGEPDRPPVRVGVTLVDLGTGMLCYSGIMTALQARTTRKAKGQQVNVIAAGNRSDIPRVSCRNLPCNRPSRRARRHWLSHPHTLRQLPHCRW